MLYRPGLTVLVWITGSWQCLACVCQCVRVCMFVVHVTYVCGLWVWAVSRIMVGLSGRGLGVGNRFCFRS